MGLDTKYRPLRYDDVLGQDLSIQACREYVRSNRGFQQSYMFHGPFGSGKTTLGRIFARALLCATPTEKGDPCDQCPSCLSMLKGASENFVEVDAATHSGKEDIRKILEDVQYGTFSGHRRLYLFDESHELSRQAMDALLKPLEETAHSRTLDKQLVCIFCTTEPQKMRPAILSRCAQPFRIHRNDAPEITKRLEYVCQHEGIEYEEKALTVIAEVKECHIRDCLKAVESISLRGSITLERVRSYLHLGADDLVLQVLESLESDDLYALVEALEAQVPPSQAYEKTAHWALSSFKVAKYGAKVPSYVDEARLQGIGEKFGPFLLDVAKKCGERPYRATYSMYTCDLLTLSLQKRGIYIPVGAAVYVQGSPFSHDPKLPEDIEPITSRAPEESFVSEGGVYILSSARRDFVPEEPSSVPKATSGPTPATNSTQDVVSDLFSEVFMQEYERAAEDTEDGGHERRQDVGGRGVDPLRGETD